MSVISKKIPVPDLVKVQTALLSVFDKDGVVELAQALHQRDVKLLSTGGTSRALKEAGLPITDVSEVTNFPEILDGRVKTLHPGIHGGLLAIRDDEEHAQQLNEHGIGPIDLVVCNLYPFEQTMQSDADYADCVENIDIGGPAMIRASAKNHAYVTTLTDPADYPEFIQSLNAHSGATQYDLRKQLAHKAFARTATYDATISNWFAATLDSATPPHRAFAGSLVAEMRYGENPHQAAGFYKTAEIRFGVATATLHQGKQLSYNNINDTDAAFELVAEFDPQQKPAVAIIKHANPCGVALGASVLEAYKNALVCDPVSAFGGIVALNQTLDEAAAEEIVKIFTEVIIAPDATLQAKEIIAAKKNLRLLTTGGLPDPSAPGLTAKTVAGGLLVQGRDNAIVGDLELEVVTKKQPTAAQMADLKFAFSVAKHVKSNAIVYCRDLATVGIGAGQMSRVDSARIAARKAVDAADAANLDQPLTIGSAVASDAFFPFADGLISAIEAGATSVIQPGGSMRDEEVIAAADEAGIAMVFTGTRHFRH